jgi:hypothetical protein
LEIAKEGMLNMEDAEVNKFLESMADLELAHYLKTAFEMVDKLDLIEVLKSLVNDKRKETIAKGDEALERGRVAIDESHQENERLAKHLDKHLVWYRRVITGIFWLERQIQKKS